MKTPFGAYRVTDLDRSLGFYTALGYVELGRVEGGDGTRLVILKLPGEPAASLELVHRPADGRVDVGSGFDHLAIQVDTLPPPLRRWPKLAWSQNLSSIRAAPTARRRRGSPTPDGYRIELVAWPPGHPDGITAADFPETSW